MKKNQISFLRALKVLIVPAIFAGVAIFAVQQSFAIGLAILSVAVILQIVFETKHVLGGLFTWDHADYFSDYKLKKINGLANVLFNLTKVLNFSAILYLMIRNYETNSFGWIGFIIAIGITIILSVLFIIKYSDRDYFCIRNVTVLGLIIAMISFVYLYFGSQLIWIPIIFLPVFLLSIVEEVAGIIGDNKVVGLVLILILSGIVSTVIQFFDPIANFAISLWWAVIGLPNWVHVVIVAIIICVALFFLYRSLNKKGIAKENARIAKEKADKIAKENKEKKEAAEKELVDRRQKVNNLVLLTEDLKKEDLIFLAGNINLIDFSEVVCYHIAKFSVMMQFFEISKIKKHIVWDNSLEEVLNLYKTCYQKIYKDDNLRNLVEALKRLKERLELYPDYQGYKKIMDTFDKYFKDNGIII